MKLSCGGILPAHPGIRSQIPRNSPQLPREVRVYGKQGEATSARGYPAPFRALDARPQGVNEVQNRTGEAIRSPSGRSA